MNDLWDTFRSDTSKGDLAILRAHFRHEGVEKTIFLFLFLFLFLFQFQLFEQSRPVLTADA